MAVETGAECLQVFRLRAGREAPGKGDVAEREAIARQQLRQRRKRLGLVARVDGLKGRLDRLPVGTRQPVAQDDGVGAELLERPDGPQQQGVARTVVVGEEVVDHALVVVNRRRGKLGAGLRVDEVRHRQPAIAVAVLARVELAVAVGVLIALLEEQRVVVALVVEGEDEVAALVELVAVGRLGIGDPLRAVEELHRETAAAHVDGHLFAEPGTVSIHVEQEDSVVAEIIVAVVPPIELGEVERRIERDRGGGKGAEAIEPVEPAAHVALVLGRRLLAHVEPPTCRRGGVEAGRHIVRQRNLGERTRLGIPHHTRPTGRLPLAQPLRPLAGG